MTTETRYLIKDDWGPGPWQDEPDRAEWRDPATGLPCLAVRAMHTGAWCGYVAVPPGHPLHGKGYDDLNLDVHGGPTYANACRGDICHVPAPGEPDDVWWIGFDCGHAFDLVPSLAATLRSLRPRIIAAPDVEAAFEHLRDLSSPLRDVYRTLDYVKGECADLARQLKEADA